MLIKTKKGLKPQIAERAVKTGNLFIEKGYTVLELAAELGVSASTAYKDLCVYLAEADPELFKKVRTVIDGNSRKRYEESGRRLAKEDMKGLKRRALAAAAYFLNVPNITYEEIGKLLGVSHTSIRRDLNVRLAAYDKGLYERVQEETKERWKKKEENKNAKR